MAIALFDRIVRVELQEMTKSNYWDNKDYEKYKLPETPNEPTGKGVLAKFEDADNGALYPPDARMSAFRVRTRERVSLTSRTVSNCERFGSLNSCSCSIGLSSPEIMPQAASTIDLIYNIHGQTSIYDDFLELLLGKLWGEDGMSILY
jgi:hypothetical protein